MEQQLGKSLGFAPKILPTLTIFNHFQYKTENDEIQTNL